MKERATFSKRIRSGAAAIGTLITTGSAENADVLAACGFDWLFLDCEHGAIDAAQAQLILQVVGRRIPTIIRVPENADVSLKKTLDLGCEGVIVPMVNTAEEAARAVAACRFPPEGERSWGPMWGDVRDDGALPPEVQNAAAICIVMVETKQGFDNLDAIASVPGLDGIYIGPNDLALSCGLGRETYRTSPDVDALIARIVATCAEHDIVSGVHCSDVEMAADWAGRGAQVLTAATDTTLLRGAINGACIVGAKDWADGRARNGFTS